MRFAHISRRPLNNLFPHQWRYTLILPCFRISRKSVYPALQPFVAAGGLRVLSQKARNDSSYHERTLYERRPDWYIRLIPLLIVLDVLMLYVLVVKTARPLLIAISGSQCQLRGARYQSLDGTLGREVCPLIAFHCIDREETDPQTIIQSCKSRIISEEANNNEAKSTPREPALKPAWKRWGTAGAALAIGGAVAGLLLVVRGRVIRRIVELPRDSATPSSIPASTGQKKVLIQTASDWRQQSGIIVEPALCEWGQGRGVFS
jgi:hypothetical protein